MTPAPDRLATVRPSRRAVLLAGPAAAGLAALSACSIGRTTPAPSASARPLDPDLALRAAAVGRERSIVAAYDAALLAAPALRGRLLLLRAEHVVHLTALGVADPPSAPPAAAGPALATAGPAAATAGPAPGTAGPALSRPTPAPDPAAAQAQLASLRTAERRAGAGHTAGLPTASPALAVVLATLAASEATHEVALG